MRWWRLCRLVDIPPLNGAQEAVGYLDVCDGYEIWSIRWLLKDGVWEGI